MTAPSAAGTITNTASVTAAEADPNPADNTASSTTVVVAGVADLSIRKTASPAVVRRGGTLTYTIIVRNAGAQGATAVVVTDKLPNRVTFVSATASQGSCTGASGTVICALGSLAPGAAATVTIVVNAPSAAGTITNTATVEANELDPVTRNNTQRVITVVRP